MRLLRGRERILVIPDLQIPFQHPDCLNFLSYIKDKERPTKVIGIGDSLDSHALSKYVSNPDGYSAGMEHKEAIKILKELYDIFPEVTEVESNHNVRLYRRAFEAGIPSSFIRSYSEIIEAPRGWSFVENIEVDDIIFEHGHSYFGMYASRLAAINNRKSTVIGHYHGFGAIHYIANRDSMIFGMNVGCLIDDTAYAFEYGRTVRHKPTLMCGVIDNGVPHLYPMILDETDHWIGVI